MKVGPFILDILTADGNTKSIDLNKATKGTLQIVKNNIAGAITINIQGSLNGTDFYSISEQSNIELPAGQNNECYIFDSLHQFIRVGITGITGAEATVQVYCIYG